MRTLMLVLLCAVLLPCLLPVKAIPMTTARGGGNRLQRGIQLSDMPAELHEAIVQKMDVPAARIYYQTSRLHRQRVRDRFQRDFLRLTNNQRPAAMPAASKWYRSTAMLITQHPTYAKSVEQFRWAILHAGAPHLSPTQMDRLLVKCLEMGWQDGIDLLLASGKVSAHVAQWVHDEDAYEDARAFASDFGTARETPIPEEFIRSTPFLDVSVDVANLVHNLNLLYFAVSNQHVHTVRQLVEEGADVNVVYADGLDQHIHDETALTMAARSGNVEIVRLLLEAGAHIDFQTQAGRTALMEAAQENHVQVFRVLVEHGATLELQNALGQTALQMARDQMNNEAAAQFLQQQQQQQ